MPSSRYVAAMLFDAVASPRRSLFLSRRIATRCRFRSRMNLDQGRHDNRGSQVTVTGRILSQRPPMVTSVEPLAFSNGSTRKARAPSPRIAASFKIRVLRHVHKALRSDHGSDDRKQRSRPNDRENLAKSPSSRGQWQLLHICVRVAVAVCARRTLRTLAGVLW